jgi:hypothetical protein
MNVGDHPAVCIECACFGELSPPHTAPADTRLATAGATGFSHTVLLPPITQINVNFDILTEVMNSSTVTDKQPL